MKIPREHFSVVSTPYHCDEDWAGSTTVGVGNSNILTCIVEFEIKIPK